MERSRAFWMPTSRRVGLGLGLPALGVLAAVLAVKFWASTIVAEGILFAVVRRRHSSSAASSWCWSSR